MARFTIPEVEALVDRWLERDMRSSTRRAYRMGIRLILKWFRSKKASLTVESVLDYKDHLKDRGLSARTINNRLMLLSSFCSWLVARERLKSNPVRQVRKARISSAHARDALPVTQVQKILERSQRQSLKNQTILHLIIYCGLRVAEVSRLKVGDLREVEGEGTLLITGKGMGEAIPQPVSGPCLSILREYLAKVSSEAKRAPMFPGKHGVIHFAGLKYRISLRAFCKAKEYRDWSGEEDYYCAVDSPEDFAMLFLVFIQRSPYTKAIAALPDPIEFFQQLAIPFVAAAPGVKREQFDSQEDFERAVDIAYTLRVFKISLDPEFLSSFGLDGIPGIEAAIECLEIERQELQIDSDDDYPEWLLGPRPL